MKNKGNTFEDGSKEKQFDKELESIWMEDFEKFKDKSHLYYPKITDLFKDKELKVTIQNIAVNVKCLNSNTPKDKELDYEGYKRKNGL